MKAPRLLLIIGAAALLYWLTKKDATGKAPLDAVNEIGRQMTGQLKKGILALDTQSKNAIAAQGQQVAQWQSGIDMQFQDAIAAWGTKQDYLTQLTLAGPAQPGNTNRRTTTGPLYN